MYAVLLRYLDFFHEFCRSLCLSFNLIISFHFDTSKTLSLAHDCLNLTVSVCHNAVTFYTHTQINIIVVFFLNTGFFYISVSIFSLRTSIKSFLCFVYMCFAFVYICWFCVLRTNTKIIRNEHKRAKKQQKWNW